MGTCTFFETNNKQECFACEACVQSCTHKAITMRLDNEGFSYPEIDNIKCVNCGKCKKVCPFENEGLFNNDSQYCFGGYSNDEQVLEHSTSGGAFSAVAQAWCDDNFVIFGAVQNEELMVEHRYITDLSELDIMRKSKYSQSKIGTAYSDCMCFLSEGKKVLFSGTPCQIAGLKRFLGQIEYSNLLTVDVICEGVPSPKYIRSFIDHLEHKYNSRVISIDYRDKDKDRWDYNVMSVLFDNGKKIKLDRWINPFFDIWMQHIMSRPSCYKCRFTTSKRVADITLGDLWGVHIFCPELYNDNKGSSLILCNTEKGRAAFENAAKYMTTRPLELDTVIKYSNRMRNPIPENSRREEFLNDADTMPFVQLKKKWVKKPSVKLLFRKYVYGTNRQLVNKYLKKKNKNGL